MKWSDISDVFGLTKTNFGGKTAAVVVILLLLLQSSHFYSVSEHI